MRAYTFLWITLYLRCRLRLALGFGLIGLSARDWVLFFSVVVRPKKGSLGAFSCMTGSLTLNGSHLVNRLSETGGSHESRLFSSDPEWVEPVDALYGSTPLGSWVGGRFIHSAHLAICGYRRLDPVGVIIVETRQWHVSTVNANVWPWSLVMTDAED